LVKISVAIPTYEMRGVGHEVLEHALRSLFIQTFKDFEVVVSDQSVDYKTRDLCYSWSDKLNIVYCREEKKRGYFTANENWAIKHCAGEIIKFLDADDFLYNETSLEKTYNAFDDEDVRWVATNYIHTYDRVTLSDIHVPTMNPQIYVFNTIGTPSCISVRNENPVLFDENLRWAGDCEWYKRLVDAYGYPKILDEITAVHLLWSGQIANTFATGELQMEENRYIISKYEK